jgi:hypothetical protein
VKTIVKYTTPLQVIVGLFLMHVWIPANRMARPLSMIGHVTPNRLTELTSVFLAKLTLIKPVWMLMGQEQQQGLITKMTHLAGTASLSE